MYIIVARFSGSTASFAATTNSCVSLSSASLSSSVQERQSEIESKEYTSLSFGIAFRTEFNLFRISTSEIKISVIINEINTTKAVKKLHAAFNLD